MIAMVAQHDRGSGSLEYSFIVAEAVKRKLVRGWTRNSPVAVEATSSSRAGKKCGVCRRSTRRIWLAWKTCSRYERLHNAQEPGLSGRN